MIIYQRGDKMSVYENILERRTIRKFKQDKISDDILKKLLNAGRVAPSAGNIQPLKYVLVTSDDNVARVFDNVKWAAYIAPEGDPKEGERPTAYICILVDKDIRKDYYQIDIGLAAENIMLSAWEENIGCCLMGAIDRDNISNILDIDNDRYILDSVIALGYINQEAIFKDTDNSIKYYLEDDILHVPKRKMDDILLKNI